jgi:hypothetical protein
MEIISYYTGRSHGERIWTTGDRRSGTGVRKLFAVLQAHENW